MLLLNPHFTIFGIEIYYYALIIVSGMAIAAFLSGLLMKRRNASSDLVYLFFIVCIPSAIICARLYWCITAGKPFSEWINIRDGGLSILGGLIGGIGAGLIICLIKKIDFLRMADCVLPTIPLAQAIGRWGNFVNGEVYGHVVTNPNLQWFPMAVEIGGKWRYALFFYESVINLIWFSVLFTLAWKMTKKPNGFLSGLFVLFYGVLRTIMEPLRDSQFILGGTENMHSQITAICMIVGAVIYLGVLLLVNYKKEGALFGSKRGDPCGITAFLPSGKEDVPDTKINLMKHLYQTDTEENHAQKK